MAERITDDPTALRDLLALGGRLVELPETDIPKCLVPEGYKLESLEAYQDRPTHKKGLVNLRDAESVGRFVKDHGDAASRGYGDLEYLSMTVILDDHDPGDGGERRKAHRVVFAPPKHPDWVEWRARDGKLMPQGEFAEFIEDQLPRIIEPSGADLLELCQDLQFTSGLAFRAADRLDSGARALVLVETVDQKIAGKLRDGQVELPASITLQLPIFRHGEAIQLEARLRHRLREGNLFLGYRLTRALEAEEEAFNRQIETIVETSGVVVLW